MAGGPRGDGAATDAGGCGLVTARLLWPTRPPALARGESLWPLLWHASLLVAEEAMRVAGAAENIPPAGLAAFRHSLAERSMWQAERFARNPENP